MTKEEILILNEGLMEAGKHTCTDKDKRILVKFSYAVGKNINIIKNEVKALESAISPTPGFLQFNKEMLKLRRDMADRDPSNNPVMQNGVYVIVERAGEYEEKMAKLEEDHKFSIEGREKQVEDYKELLKEEVPFDSAQGLKLHTYKVEFDANEEPLNLPVEITGRTLAKLDKMLV